MTWSDRRGSVTLAVAGIIAASLFIRALSIAWPFTVDDAFITFRYARNFALGAGPTFNAGQPPIEGYTSVGWLLVMAVPYLVGINPVLFAKVAGIACLVGSAWIAARWGRDLASRMGGETIYAPAFAVAAIAALPATGIHAVSGMETAMATLLFVAFLFLTYHIAIDWSARTLIGIALLGLFVTLTRPELLVPVVTALGCLTLIQRRRAVPIVFTSAAILALPLACYELWRVRYYGQLLPLSFYVKVASQSPLAGLSEILAFARFVAVYFGVPIALGLATMPRALAPAIVGVAVLLTVLIRPAPIMAYEWRYPFPVLPVLIAIAAAGLATVPRRSQSIGLGRAASHLVALTLGGLIIAGVVRHSGTRLREWRGSGQALMNAHGALGEELARLPIPGVLAIGDAGAAPYFSNWQTIDTFGLNDPAIATTRRHDADEILQRQPDVLVLISSDAVRFLPQLPWEADLLQRAGAYGLDRVATRQFTSTYYLWVFANHRTEAGRGAAAALTGADRRPAARE